MTDPFTPEGALEKAPPTKLFASYCPSRYRGGATKIHDSLGHAKAAISYRRHNKRSYPASGYVSRYMGGIIFELVDGEWQVKYIIQPNSTELPWKKN